MHRLYIYALCEAATFADVTSRSSGTSFGFANIVHTKGSQIGRLAFGEAYVSRAGNTIGEKSMLSYEDGLQSGRDRRISCVTAVKQCGS